MNFPNFFKSKYHFIVLGLGIVLAIVLFMPVPQYKLEIPSEQDWASKGIALNKGSSSSWDSNLVGALTPTTMVKKSGKYFLYYIGARGYTDDTWGPNRALGVATSTDGINFIKYSGNPIITYSPNNEIEEGVFSATATLDENGNVIMYVGAMNVVSPGSGEVRSDIRLYTSTNGYSFTDLGVVVSHSDSKVWGYGDELFPVGVFRVGSNYFVYYIAQGGIASWDLGLAWGSAKNSLPNTKQVLVLSYADRPASSVPILIGNNQYAIFIQYRTQEKMDVRTIYANSPAEFSNVVKTYSIEGAYYTPWSTTLTASTVFLDLETNTWFLYHMSKDGSSIKVKTAVASKSG